MQQFFNSEVPGVTRAPKITQAAVHNILGTASKRRGRVLHHSLRAACLLAAGALLRLGSEGGGYRHLQAAHRRRLADRRRRLWPGVQHVAHLLRDFHAPCDQHLPGVGRHSPPLGAKASYPGHTLVFVTAFERLSSSLEILERRRLGPM